MLSFIKNLLGRSSEKSPVRPIGRPGSRPAAVRPLSKAPPVVGNTLTEQFSSGAAAPSTFLGRPSPKPGTRPAPHTLAMTAEAKGEVVVSMQSIVNALPDHLKAFVTQKAASASIKIPMAIILPQLASGSVRLTFADFAELAPDGACRSDRNVASEAVEIPLGEIIPQLSQQQLRRRTNQRPVGLPPEIESPFTVNGVDKAAVGATKARVVELPSASGRSVVYAPPQTAAPQVHAESAPHVAPVTPIKTAGTSAPEYVRQEEPVPPPFRPPAAPAPKVQDSYIAPPDPVLAPAPVIRPSFTMGPPPAFSAPRLPGPVPFPVRQKAMPAPAQAVAEPPAPKSSSLTVSVQSLADGLPASLQNILMQRPGAVFQLPLEYLEPAIKAGKVYFSWSQLNEYLIPSWPAAANALPGGTVVDLPLKAIIPLFLAQLQPTRVQKPIRIDSTIPDLFADGRPVHAHAAPGPTVQAATHRPEPVETQPSSTHLRPVTPANTPAFTTAPNLRGSAISALGGLEDSRLRPDASLQELLRDMASLPGVVGALLATQDGLLVAVQLPRHLAPETVAAIVPQIYEKTIFYTQHLSFTPSRHLTLVLENLTLQLVRSGRLYLTLLAEPGFQLTPDQLLSLASQIETQHKPA